MEEKFLHGWTRQQAKTQSMEDRVDGQTAQGKRETERETTAGQRERGPEREREIREREKDNDWD